MELVHSIPSTVSIPQAVAPRPAPVLQAVPTDLAAAQTVTATDTAGGIGSDTGNAQNTQSSQNTQDGQNTTDAITASASSNYQSSVLIDPTTHEVIYRVVDVRSRQIVRQIPDQALLRMQAYNLALQNGKSTTEALAQADLEA
jgi:uncharacterized FlaG/YvyC family protein